MDSGDRQLALRLMLEDLAKMEAQAAREGPSIENLNDFNMAIRQMREEVLAAQAVTRDWIRAHTLNEDASPLAWPRVVPQDQTDQTPDRPLSDAESDDSSFSSDLELISENDSNSSSSIEDPSFQPEDTDDDTDLEYLADGKVEFHSLSDVDLGLPRTRSLAKDIKHQVIDLTQDSDVEKTCVSCLEENKSTYSAGPCGHEYCGECLKQMLLVATKDEERYPPRCCGNNIPIVVASAKVLSKKQLKEFNERSIEWSTKDRLYCANARCARFIPPSKITNEHGTCKACNTKTHAICRLVAHPKEDCPKDTALQDVLRKARSLRWQRCNKCRAMVELVYGCLHITCRSVY
ncbi:hypothetical protein N7468_003929 [Penicillium chermesinum]|uniref:RBR-type E3 ubiquitin transferase n=1 Tax=Penicillium chermesinum TaxID=63820 RepID=A0A9W9P7U7_9EURO|nr:uncharacterized protein N7468_003929 [Penicillium chermesinum]KAJ5239310.1 hypothetical protein N7468_003929 [Penicillium chermesinum]